VRVFVVSTVRVTTYMNTYWKNTCNSREDICTKQIANIAFYWMI